MNKKPELYHVNVYGETYTVLAYDLQDARKEATCLHIITHGGDFREVYESAIQPKNIQWISNH